MAKKPKHPYKRPYLDSSVFIAWIKGEEIPDIQTGEVVDRGKIGAHILTQAENDEFPIVISSLTIAEVHKRRNKPKLNDDENENTLSYFEHEFVIVQPVDREIGEEANRLCRRYQEQKLSPVDAIHIACAKRAGCDVLLAWDGPLTSITDPDIRIEEPKILGQKELFADITASEHEQESKTSNLKAAELRGGRNGPTKGKATSQRARKKQIAHQKPRKSTKQEK